MSRIGGVRPSTARSARAQDEVRLFCVTKEIPHPEQRDGEAGRVSKDAERSCSDG
jgi:hypothetical protein